MSLSLSPVPWAGLVSLQRVQSSPSTATGRSWIRAFMDQSCLCITSQTLLKILLLSPCILKISGPAPELLEQESDSGQIPPYTENPQRERFCKSSNGVTSWRLSAQSLGERVIPPRASSSLLRTNGRRPGVSGRSSVTREFQGFHALPVCSARSSVRVLLVPVRGQEGTGGGQSSLPPPDTEQRFPGGTRGSGRSGFSPAAGGRGLTLGPGLGSLPWDLDAQLCLG